MTCDEMRKNSRQCGFTLIEIVLVLVIFGILASIAGAKYFDMQDEAEKKAATTAIAQAQTRLNALFSKELLSGISCYHAKKVIMDFRVLGDSPGQNSSESGQFGNIILGTTWPTGTSEQISAPQSISVNAKKIGDTDSWRWEGLGNLKLPICHSSVADAKEEVRNLIAKARDIINKLITLEPKFSQAQKNNGSYSVTLDGQVINVQTVKYTQNKDGPSYGPNFKVNIDGVDYNFQCIGDFDTAKNINNAMQTTEGFNWWRAGDSWVANPSKNNSNSSNYIYYSTSGAANGFKYQEASFVAYQTKVDNEVVSGLWTTILGLGNANPTQNIAYETGSAYK